MLNTSPDIALWHLLHRRNRAYVGDTDNDRYPPDFVACDSDGVHWIFEGKDEYGGRDDARVQSKRRAAESLL